MTELVKEFDMAKGTCSVDGCDRRQFAKTWCAAHFNRWRRNGDVGTAPVQSRRTACSVNGCGEPHFGNGYCQTHNYRAKVNGNPLVTRPAGSPPGETHPSWMGDDVRYSAVHRRLQKFRGRAADLPCVSCVNSANTWAYQHNSEDERICDKVGLPYSTDLDDYEPMCWSCHTQLDTLHGWASSRYSAGASPMASGRWRAYATINGRQYSAKTHDTREAAQRAASALREKLLEEWQHA